MSEVNLAEENSPEVAAEVLRCGAISTSSKLLLWSPADEDEDDDDDDDADLESVMYDIAAQSITNSTPLLLPRRRHSSIPLMQIPSSD